MMRNKNSERNNRKNLVTILETLEQKKVALLLLIPVSFLYITLYPIKTPTELVNKSHLTGSSIFSSINTYLVFSNKCKIPNIDPFNKEVMNYYATKKFVSCNKLEHLVYVTKNQNNTEAYMHVNRSMIDAYSTDGVICDLSIIHRDPEHGVNSDNNIQAIPYKTFVYNITLPDKPIYLQCLNSISKAEVYANTYYPIIVRPTVQAKIEKMRKSPKPFGVQIIGIDSVSRLEMIRSMPATRRYLTESGWIEMQGYNKVGENTMPNLLPALTGRNKTDAYAYGNPDIPGGLDMLDYLWNDYNRSNYVTMYAEGNSYMSSFNYVKQGFARDPTDYYFRQYFLGGLFLNGSELDSVAYCKGPSSESERLLGILKEFNIVFKDTPSFSLIWMNHAHSELTAGMRYDLKIKEILASSVIERISEHTVIIIFSDHGIRFGGYTYTYYGRLESRLPFFYIWIPDRFKQLYPEKYHNLRSNVNKLITAYDIYMTLQEILNLADANYTVQTSRGCKKCVSLFSKIPSERSCADADIPPHFCTCKSFEPIDVNNQTVQDTAQYLVRYITKIFDAHAIAKKCARYQLSYVKTSRIYSSIKEESYILLVVETVPTAVFESTIKVNFTANGNERFKGSVDISRLDMYGPHSQCIGNAYLKTLCYCQRGT